MIVVVIVIVPDDLEAVLQRMKSRCREYDNDLIPMKYGDRFSFPAPFMRRSWLFRSRFRRIVLSQKLLY